MSADASTHDVVVVGGGLAGLVAAYRLRHRNVLLLEADGRPGGRIHSLEGHPYWLNLGAHMFGEPGTLVGDLVAELGLEARPIRGRLLGMAYRGTRALSARAEAYPFILPLSPLARLSLIQVGLALRLGSNRAIGALARRPGETDHARRSRIFDFEGHRTLTELIGRVHPEVATILTAITERNGADPAEMSAGHALRSFANVWSAHAPGRNLVGGSARFPDAIAARLGDRARYNSPVLDVRRDGDSVAVHFDQSGRRETVRALNVVLATPAFVTRRIAPDLPAPTLSALSAIRYGAYLSAAIRTAETDPMPWDGNYAISTPGLGFSVLFNQATTLREPGRRESGGSLMLFRGARGAAALLDSTDREIENRFLADLVQAFPESAGIVKDVAIQRWPAGAPYAYPGRAKLQPALTADLGPFTLAGDYLEFPNMEAAAQSGVEAAARVRSRLEAQTASD